MTSKLLNRAVSGKWDWARPGGRGPGGAAPRLREFLALKPKVRTLIVHGGSDVVTPYGVSRYVLDHMPPLGPAPRAELKLYKGGHMFYFDPAVRAAFAADAAGFYARAGL